MAPKFPDFEASGKYPQYMNANITVRLPDEMTVKAEDVIGVFVNNECRGVGTSISLADGQTAYRFEIRGTNEAGQSASFKLYSAEKKEFYKSTELVAFEHKGTFGTETQPKQLNFLLENSMTAVVGLPDELQAYVGADDKVAAFWGEECISVGEPVAVGGKTVYKMTIRSIDNPASKISFQYYNATYSYLYKTEGWMDFQNESVFGTEENPQVLPIALDGKYPLKMTAVVTLSDNLGALVQPEDKLAAFVGSDCRGIATTLRLRIRVQQR